MVSGQIPNMSLPRRLVLRSYGVWFVDAQAVIALRIAQERQADLPDQAPTPSTVGAS